MTGPTTNVAGRVEPLADLTCQVCQSKAGHLFSKQEYEVYCCRCCNHIWMTPGKDMPAPDYARVYGDSYYNEGQPSADGITRYDRAGLARTKPVQARWSLQRIAPWKPSGRLLDIGCSTGHFAHAAQQAGYDVVGIDVSEHAIRLARKEFGLTAEVASLETAEFAPGTFDVVTLWDVLEHVADPWSALQTAGRWLAPDGVLALRTPNTRCLRTMLRGYESWGMISPPEHWHLFSRRSLRMVLEQTGFRVLTMTTIHSDWIFYRQLPAWQRWPFWLSGACGWGGDVVAVATRAG